MSSSQAVGRGSVTAAAILALCAGLAAQQPPERVPGQMPNPSKEPPVVTPGATPGAPPSDAIILFDGKDLSQWVSQKDGKTPAPWTVADAVLTVKPGSGGIQTKDGYGSCQLHIEFATPSEVKGNSQGRGNSGVFFMSNYEVQVLDSYQNPTYYHGQAAAIYKQHAPLVNASRKPGEWQVYDIVFHAPEFDGDGKLLKRATFTVFHNGVLVQDHVIVMGVTSHDKPPYYEAHAAKMPLALQDHGNPMRFRNVWIRNVQD
jgi:3-keto-disaccharide hydrolase